MACTWVTISCVTGSSSTHSLTEREGVVHLQAAEVVGVVEEEERVEVGGAEEEEVVEVEAEEVVEVEEEAVAGIRNALSQSPC